MALNLTHYNVVSSGAKDLSWHEISQIVPPQHTGVAVAIRHFPGFRQLLTVLKRMESLLLIPWCRDWWCYCNLPPRWTEWVAVLHVLHSSGPSKGEPRQVGVTSNISHCVFAQIAGDNSDITEETQDGKRVTQAIHVSEGSVWPADGMCCAWWSITKKADIGDTNYSPWGSGVWCSWKTISCYLLCWYEKNDWFQTTRFKMRIRWIMLGFQLDCTWQST